MPFSTFLQKDSPLVQTLKNYEDEFIALRQELHQHPELSRREFKTSDKIAKLLTSWGIPIERNIAGTGVVGVIKKGDSNKMIGIRADMDALPITETTALPYQSTNEGVMHACGHDGHVTMLLMTAKYLQQDADFNGRVVLIFQPDEEDTAGAQRMIDEGLFEKYPVEAIFGIHNYPSAPAGTLLISHGPQMAGTVGIEIVVNGHGCHAAHPYKGVDSILVASHIVIALQSIISRNISPLESGVITIASIHAGIANNVIPQSVTMTGTLRYFDIQLREFIEERIKTVATQTAKAYGASAEVKLTRSYIPTINHDDEVDRCLNTAKNLLKPEAIILDKKPSMGAEDFAFMLAQKKGAYLFIGNGDDRNGRTLHNPNFDFNDKNVLVGAAFWSALAIDFLKD